MIPRGTIIAALLAIELAIGGEAIIAVQGGRITSSAAQQTGGETASGSRLVEAGPHKLFGTSAHPALTVDIGYADITIRAGKAAQIDVSVSASTAYGMLRAKGPITAREDGGTIRIAIADRHRWSVGDDRMVTVIVPPQTQVTVINAGDIKATGLRAEASFTSVGNGSVTVEDYDAPALQVASSDGRIALHGIVAARLDATSHNGHVEGSALQVRDGSVESTGRVTLGFATGADTLVTAESTNGSVRISGFAARASVAASNQHSDDRDDNSSSQTVRVGAGKGHLNVHSSDGNINLAQEG